MKSDHPHILFELDQRIGTLTLNRPDKLNCLSWDMLETMQTLVSQISKERLIRALIIRASGEKAFCTGGDVKAFKDRQGKDVEEWIKKGLYLYNEIERLSIPTLAVINGYAIGGGLELALACDLRIATPNAIFSLPEVELGWTPAWGGIRRLPRLIGEARAKEMIFLADKIDTAEALRLGLIMRVVPWEHLEETLAHLGNKLASFPSDAFNYTKQAVSGPLVSEEEIIYDALTARLAREQNEA